jgi:Tol biopolymer transport system component
MNEPIDPRLAAWLAEGSGGGSRDGLLQTFAVTRRTRQRPAWRFPSRWLPVGVDVPSVFGSRAVTLAALVALLIIALLATVLAVGSRPRLPAPFGLAANGPIAYASRGEIYVAPPDGGAAQLLVAKPGRHFGPAFSPTGERIAYWSEPADGGPPLLIVARSDGSGARDVIAGLEVPAPQGQAAPSWSPDGAALAFITNDGEADVLVIAQIDRPDVQTIALGHEAFDQATWSPDGTVIAVRRTADPVVSLVVVRPDGTGARELVRETIAASPADDPGAHAYNLRRAMQGFAWSPDGLEIAYSSSAADIKAVDLAGRVRLLASDPDVAEFNPVWSPSGARVAYFANNGEAIVVTDRDGGAPRTYTATSFARPCLLFWSPDERTLLGSQNGTRCPEAAGRLVALDLETGRVAPFGSEISADGLPSWQRVAP